MGGLNYRLHGLMQVSSGFLPDKKPLGHRFSGTASAVFHIIDTPPIDPFVIHSRMGVPIPVCINQNSLAELALCEASFFKSDSFKLLG